MALVNILNLLQMKKKLNGKRKYNLQRSIFFLGIRIQKKHKGSIPKAFLDYLKQTDSNHKLVMLDYDTIELNKLLIEINDIKLIDQIILTYVVNTDLPAIYSQCDVFYIHRLESFGSNVRSYVVYPVIPPISMPEVSCEQHIVNPFSQKITGL
jgi:hypothetical protein